MICVTETGIILKLSLSLPAVYGYRVRMYDFAPSSGFARQVTIEKCARVIHKQRGIHKFSQIAFCRALCSMFAAGARVIKWWILFGNALLI